MADLPPLISCRGLAKAHSGRSLFQGLSLTINPGDRLGIIGANGSGKSTLLSVLAGQRSPDAGERMERKLLRIGFVPQEVHFEPGLTLAQVLCRSGDKHQREQPGVDEVELQVRVNSVLTQLGFAGPDQAVTELSGGWQRRLAIGCALVQDPDVLFLDEPTNHLDVQGILYLENLLRGSRFAVVTISHDRVFLEHVAERILELDRHYEGGCLLVAGRYSHFLTKREEYLAARAQREASLSTKVRREIAWLSQGPKARTSKSAGRIKEAERMMEELGQLRASPPSSHEPRMDFLATGRKTKRLLVAKQLAKSIGPSKLFSDLDFPLGPKTRLGIVGANGSGKTTLLRILAGEVKPDIGRITTAPHLKVVYFDQTREQLDPDLSLRRALGPDGDTVVVNGRAVHVASWARRFLFGPHQLEIPVGRLSGGEQAKVLIARLMARPADILLLDEPTNDLDIPTLELLEEALNDFPGALVMVTHDRFLLDRVSTILLGLLGDGEAGFFADHAQWEQALSKKRKPDREKKRSAPATPGKKKPSLSYLEKREYEDIPDAIVAAEARLEEARQAVNDPLIASDAEQLKRLYDAMVEAERRVEELYARWNSLEEKLLGRAG